MSAARRCTEAGPQRGVALVEALIGMVVLSLSLAGTLYALARGARLQYANNLRAQAIGQIRSATLTGGSTLCGSAVPVVAGGQTVLAVFSCKPYVNVTVAFPGVPAPVTVSVPEVQAQVLTATVDSPRLGGTLTVSSAQ